MVRGGRREGSGAPPVTQSAMRGWGQQGEYGDGANGFRREGGCETGDGADPINEQKQRQIMV